MSPFDGGKPVLIIDGSRFDDYDGFAREFSALLDDWTWNKNLDAFNDILWGGFGTPEDGFVLRWLHSGRSREALGWAETIKYLEHILARCHPTNREHCRAEIEAARRQEGQTLFDRVVEIIQSHAVGGGGSENGIELELT
ncbi:barstar family protein [Nocardia sp. NBC_01329]|uniref:barstar family protein n=1 Tax=Nocardia sp. NBC_01329 TaxID=2903594 RepID=UPI002E110600|nr:barstar family protein [Nocardia sp. NBC_01329]